MYRAAAFIAAMLAAGWLHVAVAQEPITGLWKVTEYDPLFPENPLFGQYHYDMAIEGSGEGMRIVVSRTGARYDKVTIEGRRLLAYGSDPTRGMSHLDVEFDGDSFSGKVYFESRPKRIEGRIDPQQLAQRAEARARAAASETAGSTQRAQTLERDNAALRAQLAGTEQVLQQSRQRLALLEQELREARTAPPPARTVAPAPAPAAAVSPRPAAGLRLELIEPPAGDGDRADIADHGQDKVLLVGRVRGADRLLSLQANGRALPLLANGLFQVELARAELPETVEIVAIDMNGARAARSLSLTFQAPSQSSRAGMAAGGRKPAASQATTCYQSMLAADSPDPSGLEVCRAAVKARPDSALNHYHLGAALSRLGRHQEAVHSYREAAALWSRQ